MNAATLAVAIVVVGFGSLVAHEATHLLAARLAGPFDVEIRSWIPPRLRLDWLGGEQVPITAQLGVALAPTIVGVALTSIGFVFDVWARLGAATDPWLIALLWAGYVCPSPTDLRSAWRIVHGNEAVPNSESRPNG